MTGVMQKLAGAGVGIGGGGLGGLAAGGAAAAPFSIVSDGQDKVWVLDAASGELTFCQQYAPSGPKVIDMIGSEGQARAARAAAGAALL